MGNPALHALSVSFEDSSSSVVEKKTVQVGFRTFEIVEEPIEGQLGRTFFFAVNGIAVFSKGANWVRAHQHTCVPRKA